METTPEPKVPLISPNIVLSPASLRECAEVRWWKHWPLSLWTGSYKIPETFTCSVDGSCCRIRFASLPDQMSCSVAGVYLQPDENSFMVNCSIHFLNVITNCLHQASHQFLKGILNLSDVTWIKNVNET